MLVDLAKIVLDFYQSVSSIWTFLEFIVGKPWVIIFKGIRG